MKKFLITTFCIFLFSGCYQRVNMVQLNKDLSLPSNHEKAILVIFGPESNIPPAKPGETRFGYINYLDKKIIGFSESNTYFITLVTPGKHHIIAKSGMFDCVATVNFKSGRTYFLGQKNVNPDPSFTMSQAPSSFYPVEFNTAQQMMKDHLLVELGTNEKVQDMTTETYDIVLEYHFNHVKDYPESIADMLGYEGVVMK